jgi:hypothetical protein
VSSGNPPDPEVAIGSTWYYTSRSIIIEPSIIKLRVNRWAMINGKWRSVTVHAIANGCATCSGRHFDEYSHNRIIYVINNR